MRNFEIPRDVQWTRLAVPQVIVAYGNCTLGLCLAVGRNHVTHVDRTAQVAQVDLDTATYAHATVARRQDANDVTRWAGNVEVFELAVLDEICEAIDPSINGDHQDLDPFVVVQL